MATGAAVAAVAGTALTIKGQRDRAREQARTARENAAQKRLQALELLDRFEINAQATFVEGELLKGKQRTSFAGRGISSSEGTALSVIEETNSLVARQILLDQKEAEFKAAQIRRGADGDIRLAGDIRKAQRLESTGTFLRGAAGAASAGSR